MTDFPTLLYTSTSEMYPYPFIHLKPEKGTYLFRAEPARIGHHREYPLPREGNNCRVVVGVVGRNSTASDENEQIGKIRAFYTKRRTTAEQFGSCQNC